MPICTVARKRSGSSRRRCTARARRDPRSQSSRRRVLRRARTAISAPAKKPLTRIRARMMRISARMAVLPGRGYYNEGERSGRDARGAIGALRPRECLDVEVVVVVLVVVGRQDQPEEPRAVHAAEERAQDRAGGGERLAPTGALLAP